jgi:acrylyl-CoA reductase (NADPH)
VSVFKALVVEELAGKFVSSVKDRSSDDLPPGEVLVEVHYSSVNYKDALSANGNRGVTRRYPHTPGIDASGIVLESSDPLLPEGTSVIVTGYDLGMNTPGGFGQLIRIPAGWAVPLPEGLELSEAMMFGTAGLTAAMSVDSLLQVGITPAFGDVLVTGATGGVGSLAVAILSRLGFDVVAGTGKIDQTEFLKSLGAFDVLSRDELLQDTQKPILKERWGAVVDTVGGDILMNAIKATRYGGSVTCCGMVSSPNFQASVFPFILRGVNLLGIDSVELPLEFKLHIWNLLAGEWKVAQLKDLCQQVSLDELPAVLEKMIAGEAVGRTIVAMQ